MRMHRTVLLVVFAAMMCLMAPKVAQGQVLIALLLGDKVTSEKFHLGLNVGVNGAQLDGIDSKMRTGLNLGIIGEWRFARTWYLQPEILPFYYAGASGLPASYFPAPPEVEDVITDPEVRARLKYFAIPVLLKFGVANDRLLIGAGPQVGFLLSSTATYKGESTNGNKVSVDQDIGESTESTDAGVVFNLEWKVRGGFSPSVNVRYYLGLKDTVKDNPGDAVYNRVLSALLTVPIGGDPSEVESGNLD